MASIRVSKCFEPLLVIASGNSAVSLPLKRVTFLTSMKLFFLFFSTKKSKRVSLLKKLLKLSDHYFSVLLLNYFLEHD